ncbi:MAG: T9SS type A sorting domain-containing protein [Ignavibacteriales bacterium]|nr:T9SS type A sorting domain-containing protein [Ignavibacteriales bacterium]
MSIFVLDLNSNLVVDSVNWKGYQGYNNILKFSRLSGRIWITLPYLLQKSDTISVIVSYHGVPKVASNPPWDAGFVWKRTKTGEIWAGVACEEEGADIWWPCKDHPSDEPDSVDLFFTVPGSLECVSNGKLLEVIDHGSIRTFHWYVTQPISNYAITFYLGPFQKISISYQSVTGEMIPSEYWFLPYNIEKANQFSTTFLKDLRFFEEVCGPFPFRAEKYGLADAPYWGMEHQTIIAYGNDFALNSYGFDYIHLHELAHEWWGNLVTAKDWSDVWIHEGFATYMEALFVERTLGFTKYKSYMAGLRNSINNINPVAPLESTTALNMFSSNDVYNKGAWILHTLRHYLGDQSFFRLVRRLAYPDSAMESVTNGKQCRLATTDDFHQIAEQWGGLDLDWFFNVYLRQAALPKIQYSKYDTILTLRWVVPNNLPFSLPIDVQIGAETVRVDMYDGSGIINVPNGKTFNIDPDRWILMAPAQLLTVSNELVMRDFSISVYPNPFNPATTIWYDLPKTTFVSMKLFDILGREVASLKNDLESSGSHIVKWDATNYPAGLYFCRIQADDFVGTEKLILLK